MLEELPGARQLRLRRRRSRLPWIYVVYHAGRSRPAESRPGRTGPALAFAAQERRNVERRWGVELDVSGVHGTSLGRHRQIAEFQRLTPSD